VPALQLDDGEVLTEVQVICQYLADQKPDSGLAPRVGTMARHHVMEMLNFAATEVHKQIGMLFNPKMTPAIGEFQLGNIERRLNALDRMFEGRQYAAANRFSIVDPYLFVALNWSNKLALDLGRWPNIKPYVARVAARPKVQETMRAEGLIG
jgi:glutathione S-transferase